ncbi:MAG: hypothetical protein QNJ73_00635 [Gammaproteobacteria bacterium]|nr:hypothetical protein [Gammaproteobacteria bacterium]
MPNAAVHRDGVPAPLPEPPRFAPYGEIGPRPNIIVDGAPLKSTVLTLSHWPNNSTPAELKRDTSTETVFAYLDAPHQHRAAGIVSNNHFDEDGLFSMYALCAPAHALDHRDLLIDASRAGDFGVYESRDAARLCFAIESCASPDTSPLDADIFTGCERQQVAALYPAMLDYLPDLLDRLRERATLWADQDAQLAASLRLIQSGVVTIEEHAGVDLAVVRIPADLPAQVARRYLRAEAAPVHPFAIHQYTDCNRIVRVQGRRYELQYRYESWVQLASRRPALRADLAALAARLNEIESAPGTWIGEDVNEVAPRLFLDGAPQSALELTCFLDLVTEYLEQAPVAWDPYDWQG